MTLDALIEDANKLLPSPQILPQLLIALKNPNASQFEIIELVRVDPALTAQILAVSNSAFYSFSTQTMDLVDAINRIGFDELYRLVGLCLSNRISSGTVPNYYLDEGEMWENSVAVALTMEKLASDLGLDSGLAYTIGLIHSIGKIVINQLEGSQYEQVYMKVDDEGMTLIEAEQAVLGFDHVEAACSLLEAWKYPESLCLPIANHLEPTKAGPDSMKMAAALHLSQYIVSGIGLSYGRASYAFNFDETVLEILGISPEGVQLCMVDASKRLDDIKSLLNSMLGKES